jgi:hypothetical protein
MGKRRETSSSIGLLRVLGFIEYLAAMTSIHGTYGNLAYDQMDFLPILQIAVLTGI